MNHVGIVILCRYSSSRLPGKILMPIDGRPILQHIVDRISLVADERKIIVATSTETSDDKIAAYCKDHKIQCYRGSLDNVAERFYLAGKSLNTSYICRINGDNFFIDPAVLEYMCRPSFIEGHNFVTNVPDRTFPFGMSIEILNTEYFGQIIQKLETDRYREHVSLYLYEQGESINYKKVVNTFYPTLKGVNLAVDTEEDLRRTKLIYKKLKKEKLPLTGQSIAKIIDYIEII